MRILYVVHQFFPEYVGGTEQDTLDVAQEMHRRGHQVAIFHRAPGSSALVRIEWEGIPLYRAQAGPMTPQAVFISTFGHRGLERAFRTAFQEFEPDLVHFQHLKGLPARLVSLVHKAGCPVVISLRDFWFICLNAQLLTNDTREICDTPGKWSRCARCGLTRIGMRRLRFLAPLLGLMIAARNALIKRVIHQADALLAFSRFVQKLYIRYGAPSDRVHYVKRGLRYPQRWESHPRDDKVKRFTYIGGLAWQKGVHILVEAFNGLDNRAELVIAGDETKFPDYVRYLKEIARHPGIQFVGRLSHSEVWRTLADSDVVVVPSLWYETYSMIVHEAFAMGVPVIASAHGALEEAVKDGVNGLLVPPGDVGALSRAMRRLVEQPELLEKLRENVHPSPTMEIYISELETLYLSLK
ncbi:MAG TPA: glycosyltransferase [Chloroflexi bacterium]|nr:glycosyltransferase [Chloroflexota bacterium]